jgi:hypothetical protein
MENRINVAELLKDCPSGMELNCTIFDNVSFVGLQDSSFPIIIHTPDGCKFLTHFGCYHNSCSAKCVIFPKGKTTWEGFVPPCKFKDGDIISNNTYIAIFYKTDRPYTYFKREVLYYHCWYDTKLNAFKAKKDFGIGHYTEYKLATEEEKAKLFQAIKDNGYKWNEETKTLETFIKPKFKVGDRITNGKASITIGYIDNEYYYEMGRNVANRLFIKNQDEWELVPDKFDISTLKPFDSRVLVRDYNGDVWRVSFWGCLIDNRYGYKYDTTRGYYKQCIPYEGNEYLLGKTEECKDFYKNW